LSRYKNNMSKSQTPIFIIFNKFDLPQKLKKFGKEDIKTHLKETVTNGESKIKIYHEVSAKENLNVEVVFETILTLLFGHNINFPLICPDSKNSKKSNEEFNFGTEKYKKSFSIAEEKSTPLEKRKTKKKCC
jgi:GTPase SAR1 family protein